MLVRVNEISSIAVHRSIALLEFSGLSFASPGLAIAACSAIALPILIHLFLRRRRLPIEWAAMDLLREALRRVERRRRVERWLLLLVRCLLIATAGLAIAAPFLGTSQSIERSARTSIIVLDDSAASNERVGQSTAFEQSREAARLHISSLTAGDRVSVIQTSKPRQHSREPASLDTQGVARRLSTLSSTESPCDFVGSFEAAAAILAREESRGTTGEIFIASALRAGSVGNLPALAKLSIEGASVSLLALSSPNSQGSNLQISAIESQRIAGAGPDAPTMLRMTIRRDRGEGQAQTTVRVTGPTLSAPVERAVELSSGEREKVITVALTERVGDAASKARRAVVAAISSDVQPIDDQRALILAPTDRLRVAVVDRRTFDPTGAIDKLSGGEWVARALAPEDQAAIDVVTVDPVALDARTLATSDTVVVVQPQLLSTSQWTALSYFVMKGGVVAVLPSANERTQIWSGLFTSTFSTPWKIAIEVKDLDPVLSLAEEQPSATYLSALRSELTQLAPTVEVFRTLAVDASMDKGAAQLLLQGGQPFLLTWRPPAARGTVALFTSAMEVSWTSLPVKPLMVPLWQEIVAEGRRYAAMAQSVSLGVPPTIDQAGVVELRPVSADGGAMPGTRSIPVGAGGRTTLAVERSGLLEMLDSSGRVQGMIAAVLDPTSASVAVVEQATLDEWLKRSGPVTWINHEEESSQGQSSTAAVRTIRPTSSLATTLFAIAVTLAFLESFLARRFSHATQRSRLSVSSGESVRTNLLKGAPS